MIFFGGGGGCNSPLPYYFSKPSIIWDSDKITCRVKFDIKNKRNQLRKKNLTQ